VEQQSQHSKEIARLVDIGVLEEEYSSEWAFSFQSFPIPRKNGTIIKVETDFRKLNIICNITHFPFQRLGKLT
jgi:hypothetical protein